MPDPKVRSVYGERTDRIPPEFYEPHESIAIDVTVHVVINLAFDDPPTQDEWDKALEENVTEALVDGYRWDTSEWSVLYVEEAPPVARCGRSIPHRAHSNGPRWCAGNMDVVQSHETPVQEKE